jgi:hypothetical protein
MNEINSWPWPDELDALTAASNHHKLLFENDFVRVIDACIPRGETTELHTHRFPASLYIVSMSDFIRLDQEGKVVLDSRNLATPLWSATALWSDALPPHSLKNVGASDLHVISVEIKNTL